ncbi:MAG TPA: STM4013/SEN3800 family hydrolase [Thiolinea sp.]|nr:STM4013/SEN3800 family hydrolase [Thiolinea sp.]
MATPATLNARHWVGTHDILLLVLDSLRLDVAQQALASGRTPFLHGILPGSVWQPRQTHGSYTFPAHQAFFMGYFPVPVPRPADYQRVFACAFSGSTTTGAQTWVTPAATIIQGLQAVGYHTLCIGGVGFFNPANALGRVLPGYFMESHWSDSMGVTGADSTRVQVALACERLQALPRTQRVVLFINVSALHQPNCLFTHGATTDSVATQTEALAYVDRQLPALWAALRARGAGFGIICSDHGTAYGEDGCWGHGFAHPVVWNVPYAEITWESAS